MNRRLKAICLISVVIALTGLAVFYHLDHQQPQILKASCTKSEGGFILTFKRSPLNNRKLETLNLRPGLISITVKPKVKEVLLVTKDETVIPAEKKSDTLFRKQLRKNLILVSIVLTPKSPSINKIDLIILRKPLISIPLVFLQFLLLFSLCCIVLLVTHILFQSSFRRQEPKNLPVNELILFFVFSIALFFVFILFNFKTFFDHYGFSEFSPLFLIRTIFFNLVLSAVFTALFLLLPFRPERRTLPLIGAALASLPILLVKIPFDVKTSADSLLWVFNLIQRNPNISFAESFSLMLNKFLFGVYNLFAHVNERSTLIMTGKLMGVFFIFSFFILINTFEQFTYKKKLLFFLLFSTFSFNILLFGFPEFRYYSLPFLMLALAAARKYLSDSSDNKKYIFLAALMAMTAGLFHGIAYFSFPAILLLPLFKNRGDGFPGGSRLSIFGKRYALIFLAIGFALFVLFLLVKTSHYTLQFHTVSGGFDGRKFISFLPGNIHFPNAVVFLEPSYFISRGWIFLITGSFVFLFFFTQWRKKGSPGKPDLMLLLFGFSQLLIILFWGYDLGIFEFDLYIAPTTFMYLFFIQYFLTPMDAEKNGWKAIIGFSMVSMLYPLVSVMLLGNKW